MDKPTGLLSKAQLEITRSELFMLGSTPDLAFALLSHIDEQQKLIDKLAEWVRPLAEDGVTCEHSCDHSHCRRVRKARALWEEVDREQFL